MSARFSYTEPLLCTYKHNVKKPWFVHFEIMDNLTGQVIRKQFRGGINYFHNKAERIVEGNTLKRYWKKQLQAGWNPFGVPMVEDPVARPRVLDAFQVVYNLKAVSCGKRTMETYRHALKLFSDWLKKANYQHLYIEEFDAKHARAYMDYLAIEKGYAGRTYNDKLVNMSTFSNCLVDRDLLVKNPFRKIKKVPIEIGRNIAFSDDERERLCKYLQENDKELFYFTQFVYYCFIRRSELTRLKIKNIDWKIMTIVVPSSASKNKKQESVVIPNSFVVLLKEMELDQLPEDYFIFGRKMKPGPDPYINYNHISSRHNSISKSLGISDQKGLYSWKHSGVCNLYPALNGDMYALMRQLRHSELSTTQIYLKSLGLVDNSAVRTAIW